MAGKGKSRGRLKQLWTAVGVAMDGGRQQQEAERQAEVARLHVRDGRAIPQHIAIIMDGNGRWATQRHLPRLMGHKAGVDALRRVVELCHDEHIPMLSVYAFSTENWGRPQEEVDGLMRLFWDVIKSDLERLLREGVRLRHIGRMDELAPDIQQAVRESMDVTQNNQELCLNVCFNYGGRAEIVDAVRQIVASGVAPGEVTEELISRHLYTRDLPDPDLVIRTAGEMRLSNYLIWQAAYAEYYSTPVLWPDFDRDAFLAALHAYGQRKRRFGKLDDTPLPPFEGGPAADPQADPEAGSATVAARKVKPAVERGRAIGSESTGADAPMLIKPAR
ncbi:MAG TPA: polyprenyl diphosphate synthase [Ktedonobacterales bacterium]|jgi:undecaprenyl diphosphate synthase|nr:polyprenyl diphosphate synthase [Ktedonobacterales bacterium]